MMSNKFKPDGSRFKLSEMPYQVFRAFRRDIGDGEVKAVVTWGRTTPSWGEFLVELMDGSFISIRGYNPITLGDRHD